jgi:predicted phage baseplate assembly protein
MPLFEPALDTHTFDELVTESRDRIPRLAPQWTDHNASDPGITLIELVAWLVEQDLFRLDRVPDDEVRAFLHLLGSGPRPATVATAVVSFGWRGAGAGPDLPAGLQLAPAGGGAATFETARRVLVSAARLTAVLSGPDGALTERAPDGAAWPALGADPAPGAALYLGFDRPLGPPGAPVRVALLRDDPGADATTWAALIAEWTAAARERPPWCAPRPLRGHRDVAVVWEYRRADGSWATLPRVADSTRALTLSGWMTFRVPPDQAAGGPGLLTYVRARLLSGAYGVPPTIHRILLNAVPARHAVQVDPPENGGVSRGWAEERVDLARTPVVAGSTTLTWTDGTEIDAAWREVPDWLHSGPADRHAVVDHPTGRVRFGNGRRGRAPRAGWRVSIGYRVGSGPSGNIAAGTLTTIPSSAHNAALVPGIAGLLPDLDLHQGEPAFGGDAAETLADATARVIERIQAADKAVTTADFERLARRVPGVAVSRAATRAGYDPRLPCVPAAGMVTVVVVPDGPGPRPTPTEGMLREVAAYLDRRRLVTTEVTVVGPCYDEIAVGATLAAAAGADPAGLTRTATEALDAFLHPLRGGPDGHGYPIGRSVYATEVLALLAALPGVAGVTGLELARDGGPPVCGNVDLCPECLPTPGHHRLTVTSRPPVRVPERSRADDCR